MSDDIIRVNAEGVQQIKTGLGWRDVLSPTSTEATTALPVIDIGDIYHKSQEARRVVAKKVCDAAVNSGFFYISNHGVSDESINSIFAETKRFIHELPLREKMKYDTAKHKHYWGYYPIILDSKSPSGASKSGIRHAWT